MGAPSTMGLLRQPQFRRIFLAQAISTLGDNIAPIAVAFAVLSTRHSATDLGLVLAARTLPLATLVLFGGAWADRLPRKSLMVSSDVARFLTQAAFAIILFEHEPPLWALILLQAGNGAATAFFRPASSGLVQEVVPEFYRQRSNALLSATNNVSLIAGPACAALLISLAGNSWAVAADALTFAVSALFLFGIKVSSRISAPRLSILREIGQGFKAVAERRWLGLQILGFAQVQLFVLATYAVLGPLVSEREYGGATVWALVLSVGGVGALAGDAISMRFKPSRPLVAANCLSLALIPLLVALACNAPIWTLIACGFLFGVGLSMPNTLWFTALQDKVPLDLMSRVSALDWMGSTVLRPIGLAIVAPLAVIVGPPVVLLVAAGVTVLTLGGLVATPAVRGLIAGPGSSDEVPRRRRDGHLEKSAKISAFIRLDGRPRPMKRSNER